METARYGLCSAALDGKVYVAGGQDDQEERCRSVERFDPIKNEWEKIAPMSTARYACSAAVLDGKLYIAGGYDGTRLSSVERYDPVLDTWRSVESMCIRRRGVAVSVAG